MGESDRNDDEPAIEVPAAIVAAMIAHARREMPLECCGLLSGVGRAVSSIHPLVNEAASPVEFLALVGLIEPFRTMRAKEEDLLGIYHSHPRSPAVPSRTDLARNHYPDTPHFIISLACSVPVVRAYRLWSDSYSELAWREI